MSSPAIISAPSTVATPSARNAPSAPTVDRYGAFEQSITHDASLYSNAYKDVDLEVVMIAPDGTQIRHFGFYDGDGQGGNTGDVWKLRLMPEMYGVHTVHWRFSDGSLSGGTMFKAGEGGRKPAMQVYDADPRWLSQNGEPVLLKAYKPGWTHNQDISWIKPNIYEPLANAGYNHLMLQSFPSSFDQTLVWSDYPGSALTDPAVTNKTAPFDGTVNLSLFHAWDEHLSALLDLDMQAWLWTGIGGNSESGADHEYASMSAADQEAWVKYICARYAAFSHIAWGYWYELDADDTYWTHLATYDPWGRLRSGQWHPQNTLGNPYEADNTDLSNTDWYPVSHASTWRFSDAASPDDLHQRILDDRADQETSSSTTIPYYNSESALWTNQSGIGTTVSEIAGLIWATVTAGAYFNWNGAAVPGDFEASTDLLALGYESIVQVAYDVLENTVPRWYDLETRDDLLTVTGTAWAMADKAATPDQYLVFSRSGVGFDLDLTNAAAGLSATWVDARTGSTQAGPAVNEGASQSFTPPNTSTDWVLVIS